MSADFVAFGWRFLLTKPRAVVLSVWIGVGGCTCPNSSTVTPAGIACRAEDMTFLMIWAIFNTAPLSVGSLLLSERKKWPPALLRAFGSVRYDASLWTFSTMLLEL